jgi:hypothetical protein
VGLQYPGKSGRFRVNPGCVVQHVDLLKERLTTQVRVVRGAGGTSRIEVVA